MKFSAVAPLFFLVVITTAFAFQSSALWPRLKSDSTTRHRPTDTVAPLQSAAVPEDSYIGDASRKIRKNELRHNESHDNVDNPVLPPSPKGVIFDMDGTLIQHCIDFPDMRRRIYQVADADPIGRHLERTCVLTLAKQLSPEGQLKAQDIFDDIEAKALRDMRIMPGGVELLQFLEENGLKRGVLTRNLEKNAQVMHGLYLEEWKKQTGFQEGRDRNPMTPYIFHSIVARDTSSHPQSDEPLNAKPHPDGILHICSMWGCHPSEVIMVGDSANDDMTAANRAGCGGAVLLTQPGGRQLDTDSGYAVENSKEELLERTPSLVVESLFELKMYLQVLLKESGRNLGKDRGNVVANEIGVNF